MLEAKIERGKGIMTTALIQNGSLRLGDTVLVGEHYGRIKAMYDYKMCIRDRHRTTGPRRLGAGRRPLWPDDER